jgi:hypothetical protein
MDIIKIDKIMEEKEMENNKIIAEFMGFQKTNIGWYDNKETLKLQDNTFDNLEFDTSWDWLMPVIKKCLIGEAEQDDKIINITIKNIYEGICNQDISFAYNSVVEYIKQLNK